MNLHTSLSKICRYGWVIVWITGILACSPSKNGRTGIDTDQPEDATEETFSELTDESGVSAARMEQERAGLAGELHKLREQIDVKISRLQERLETEGKDTGIRLGQQLSELEIQRDTLEMRMQELQQASETNWQEVKTGMQSFTSRVRQLLERLPREVPERPETPEHNQPN
jgi:predicted  nucleic acid-binding Zn-ribbon protein